MKTVQSAKDILIENGIKVHIKGVEYDLNEVNPDDLARMMDELTEEEAEAVAQEVQDQLGVEDLAKFVEELDAEEELLRGESKPLQDNSKATINLDPIILAVPDDGMLTHDPYELQVGIKQASYIAGQFTALVNAGLSDKQAFDFFNDKIMELLSEEHYLDYLNDGEVE